MGFDVRATRAWWDFFHRYSFLYHGNNFDLVLILGLNLLQCHACQTDAINFYKTIGNHKTPFEKIHILHNYVNRKLKKRVFEIEETRKMVGDILHVDGAPNWKVMTKYYFDLLFLMANYLEEKNMRDLKDFSAYVYQGFQCNKKRRSLAINSTFSKTFSQEQLKLEIYEYYSTFQESMSKELGITKQKYRDIYGKPPQSKKYCHSCAQKHQLYLEKHNTPNPSVQKVPVLNPLKITQMTQVTQQITKPAITKPATSKPAITKPAITKPATSKPAINQGVQVRKKPVDQMKEIEEKNTKESYFKKIIVNQNGKTVRKKVIPASPKEQKRLISFRNSRIIRYQQKKIKPTT